jgi:hypothetical protein
MKTFAILLACGCCASTCALAHAQYLPNTPYLSVGDSPFASLPFSYLNVENFEDATLTPGLTATGGVRTFPGAFTDSVDADDGLIDGSGIGGGSYISSSQSSSFEFAFDAGVLGNYPTHAGVVWTDVGNVLSGSVGVGSVSFVAFDSLGVSLGTFGPVTLGDGLATGGTAEDRFFGAFNSSGISRIVISMSNSVDWEVDHVQYAFVPAPASAVALGFAALAARRRRPSN